MNALEALKKIRDYVGICGNVMPYELLDWLIKELENAH